MIAAAKAKGVELHNRTKPAALAAVLATGVREEDLDLHALNWPLIEEVRAKLAPEQRYIRGIFCGGTLCDEAMFLALEKYDDVYWLLTRARRRSSRGETPCLTRTSWWQAIATGTVTVSHRSRLSQVGIRL